MKKYLAVLMCFALVLTSVVTSFGFRTVDVTAEGQGTKVEALRAPAGVDVTSPITEAGWGKPTIHVDKNSDNASLWQHNATPEDSAMDIYLRWDDSNLYIGVVSADTDARGDEDSWEGDGVQFKICAGSSMGADAKNIYFTLGADNASMTAGSSCESYAKNVQVVDGKLYASIAIPFADLGMVAADVKNGAELSFSILRISATSEHEYAGWLAWGAFFGANHQYNANCYADNLIVLSSKIADTDTVIEAGKVLAAPDMADIVTEEMWGKPAISVNKNSYNATLWQHNATPEDSSMDIYALWDAENLYLGIVSPDTDARGDEDSWEGDGVQFKICAGSKMGSDAKNIYFTLGADNVTVTAGDSCRDYDKNVQVKDGKLYATIAIPFADLGMTAADVKGGAELAFSILRISATSEHEYAGWLAWGAFFGPNHQYNANNKLDNVIVLSDEITENALTVIADKTNAALDMSELITADVWGVPNISVNKNSVNATLWQHNALPEDSDMDLYFRWDATNLYIGVVSPEADVRGDDDSWEGDGVQFKICAGTTMGADAKNIYFTLAEDKVTVVAGDSCAAYEKNIQVAGGKMYATIAIPFADLGMTSSDVKPGAALAFSIIRISATSEHEYAGWLAWGAFFGANHQYNANSFADNIIVLGAEEAQTTVVEANRLPVVPNLTGNLEEGAWGKPTISVDKNSFNASLWQHNAKPEDSSMDIYLRWDATNLYIGVVSADTDARGDEDSWEGDGVQFKICAGNTMGADAKNIYFTLGADNTSVTAGDSCKDYDPSVQVKDGKLTAIIAIPFADLGMVASDVKAGAKLSFSILRISATSQHEYAGWLAWGAFFGPNHQYNANSAYDNVIVLSGEVETTGTVIEAEKAVAAPDLSGVITSDTWGKPAISVNKNSYNATLWQHNAKPEDSSMDIYAQWDATNLYLGIVSPDTDVRGDEDSWEGDGVQFKLCAGNTMGADAKNIYFTLDADKVTVTAGDSCKDYEKNVKAVDGKLYAVIAIPFADLGMTASDVKPGAELCFSILRISATSEHEYAGWLAWGAFFGPNHQYNANNAVDNVIVLSDRIADNATVIKANKTSANLDMSAIITASTWGEPAIYVNKNSYNATLWQHNAKPEDSDMDIYTLWDAEYLYIGVVSPDADARGDEDSWEGDGVQFKLCAGNTMGADAKNIYFTLGADNASMTAGDSCKDYDKNVQVKDGKLYATIAIPFADLGLTEADVKAGAEFAFSILRISATSEHEYAGWLAWGAFFGPNHEYNANNATDNVIVLVDANASTSEEVEEFVSKLTNIPKASAGMMSEDGIAGGHKIAKTANGVYAVYLTRSDVLGSAVNEFTLQKVGNGTSEEVAYGYTYYGLQDLVADKDGNVYVIGGSSSWNMLSLNDDFDGSEAEQAVLNIWRYNEATGVLNGYTTYKEFADGELYTYLTSTVDTENGKIYTAFYGYTEEYEVVVECFVFDIATMSWEEESVSIALSSEPSSIYAYAGEEGMDFIYNDGFGIYAVENGVEEYLGEGLLEDVYKDSDGDVHVLYLPVNLYEVTMGALEQLEGQIDNMSAEEVQAAVEAYVMAVLEGVNILHTTLGAEAAEETEICGLDSVALAEADGKLYLISVNGVDPITVTVYDLTEGTSVETQMDDAVILQSMPMLARTDNGSIESTEIAMMLAGQRGITTSWYYGSVSVAE